MTNFLGGRAGGGPGPAEGWGRWRGSLVVENLPMCRESTNALLFLRKTLVQLEGTPAPRPAE